MQKAQMDPLNPRNNIELVLKQERKWMGSLKIACVTPKRKDSVFETSVLWLIGQGYIPQTGDHRCHQGELVLAMKQGLPTAQCEVMT